MTDSDKPPTRAEQVAAEQAQREAERAARRAAIGYNHGPTDVAGPVSQA